jgi:hypothetical protein
MYQGRLYQSAFFCVIPGLTVIPDPLVIPDLFGNPFPSSAATPGACCFAALYG